MTEDFLKIIETKNPTHYKKILKTFSEYDGQMDKFDNFFSYLEDYFISIDFNVEKIADSYLFVVGKMFEHRVSFMRDGKYPIKDEEQKKNYDDKELMHKYMLGLAISQYLWRHHVETFNFYLDCMKELGKIDNVLEVGVGMGHYLSLVLEDLSPRQISLVDISNNSINIAKKLLKIKHKNYFDKIEFTTMDVNNYKPNNKFDLIIMYGVVSCLSDPVKTLKVLNNLLNDDGKLFVFACSNCPTPDHVFRFKSPEHIQNIIIEGGFSIIKEKISISENLPLEKIEKFKLDIAHALILKKDNK